VLVLVLICETLLLYWSALQHSRVEQQLRADAKLRQHSVSAVPQPHSNVPAKADSADRS
jgi:hypothetical protein